MTDASGALALQGIRVAEIGTGRALAYCGKLFADLGASVVKIEPPGGDPDRSWPPLVDVGGGRQESALFAWLSTNKQSVTAAETDADRIREIAAASDVLLDSRLDAWDDAGPTGHAALRAAFPNLIIVSITWFGVSGPYKDYAAADAVVRALAGLVKNVGPIEAPVMLSEHQSCIPAALSAFSAALAALLGGKGRRYEISVHDACSLIPEFQQGIYTMAGIEEHRWGRNRFFPVSITGIYPTKSGWLGVTAFSADQWRGWCAMLGIPELAQRPEYAGLLERLMAADSLDALFTERLAARTAREWADEAIIRRVPVVVTPEISELLASPVHRSHGAFGTVRIGDAAFEAPTLPQRLTATPPIADAAAPLAGQHDSAWRPSPAPAPLPRASDILPLSGLRIIDMTMGWAGPVGTRQLADLGAEVIKVEGRGYPDWWRGADYTPEGIAAAGYEKPLYFNWQNRNKTGITLDLTRKEGVDLLLRLVATADAVVENYGTGVLAGFGLGYEAFRKARPDIVVMSMPAFGTNTPWAEVRAYGSTLEHAAGLPMVTGAPGDPPTMNHVAYGDPIGGLSACPAVLAALIHRARTGQGQYIDLSQVECLFPLVAPWMIEQSVTGRTPPKTGNRHPLFAPHGCFPCEGENDWVVIAVTSDEAWQALAAAIGRPDLAADPALTTAAGRRAAEDALEAAITEWTRARSPDEAMEALQAAGVAAGAARGMAEMVLFEPHLMERGYWQEVERPHLDYAHQPSPAFRENGEPYPIRNPAPTLGQSSREVLTRILGLTPTDLDRLEAAGVTGEAPIPLGARAPRSAALIHDAATQS